MEDFKRILIPTDGSKTSEVAVDKGLSLARKIGAKVKVLFVVDKGNFRDIPPDDLITTLRGHMESKGNEMLDEIQEKTDELGVEMEKSLVHGHPDDIIVEESKDFDLIVIGTHDRSGLSRLLIGSVTERVVKHALCPVMVIKTREE
ncbi:MAG: universal stress protein [Thermoplasmata archaeon]